MKKKTSLCEASDWMLLTLVILPLSVFPFWPSIQGDFVFDDTEAIVWNADVTDPNRTLAHIFQDDFWGKPVTSNGSHKSYRPLTVLTFRWNFQDKRDTKQFHVVNLSLHAAACCLLWFVYGKLQSENNYSKPLRLFATALFACHPIHTENVAGIIGRADVMAAICFFVSFLLYAKIDSSRLLNSIYLFCLAMILAVIAMLFKENGITVLGFCSAYSIINTRPFGLQKAPLRGLLAKLLGISITGACAVTFRWWIMGCSLPTFQPVDNPASFTSSIMQRIMNYNFIYAINTWILLCPIWLCFDWSMGCISLIQNLLDIRMLSVILFWATIAGISSSVIYCHNTWKLNKELALALTLCILPFLPASNLLMRVGFVVAERVLYVSSAGFCLIVAIGYQKCRNRYNNNLIDLSAVILLLVFITRCWQRSGDWSTEEKLFSSGLLVCPSNAKVHYNIAKNAADNGKTEVALKEYKEALRLHPDYDRAMNNLANILKDMGHLYEAEKLLLRAVEIRPDFAAAWMNLGIVQAVLKKHHEAEISYLTAIAYRPNYPDCYYNLGNLFLDLKLYDRAYEAWMNATRLKPTHSGSWNNVVVMFDNLGDYEMAKSLGEQAIQILPNEAFVYFNLANVLGKLADFINAEKYFLKAIEFNSTNPTYLTNLGVLYHRWKKYPEAANAYQNALRLNPNAQSARENLQKLHSNTRNS
ncbi:hypothetical protein CHUAL_012657 [Chamberlinius hualienensis]